MKRWKSSVSLPMLLLSNLLMSGVASAAEETFGCNPHPGSVVAMTLPQRAVPLNAGTPGQPRHARNADWKALSPDGKPVTVTGCHHEGFLRLNLPKVPECAVAGCWIASRWVVTERSMVSAPRPCEGLPGTSVAASRDPPRPPGEGPPAAPVSAVAEKCVRLQAPAEPVSP